MPTNKKEPRIIQNCVANGVVYDKASMDAIIAIAHALESNADSLGELAKTLQPINIKIGAMFHLGDTA